MKKRLKQTIDNIAKRNTYKRSNGETICVIPSDVVESLQKRNKTHKKEIIDYIEEKGYEIVEKASFETVRQYDHLDLIQQLNKFDIVIPEERQNKIVEKIEKLASDYTSMEGNEYKVNIPHHKILYLNLMPWELAFVYDYIESRGYNICGIDLTINGEIDSFTRVRKNDRLDTDRSTKPYKMEKRMKKLFELAEIKRQLDLLEKMPEMTYKEEVKYNSLLERYYSLREELLNHNMRLVYQYIIDFELFGDVEEKTSQAFEGYIKAFDNYIKYLKKIINTSSEQGINMLSSYVYQQIKWTLSEYRDEKELILTPENIRYIIYKINRVFQNLSESIGPDRVTNSDISEQVGISEKMIECYRTWGAPVLSLDELLESDENMDEYILGYPYQDEQTEEVFDQVVYLQLKEELQRVLTTTGFNQNEIKVLAERFGLYDGRPKTLEEVGGMFGVTRERIRQTEGKTLAKLRHPSRTSRLVDYLE